MEDIRKLLRDHEAEIAPESLGYLLRGLNAALHELIAEGDPSSTPEDRLRYKEMVYSVSYCAQLVSVMLSRWLGDHRDVCAVEED